MGRKPRSILFFDGASFPNPGEVMGLGAVLIVDGRTVREICRRVESPGSTNNRAEYMALIDGLKAAEDEGVDELEVRGDSELIVKQLRGEYAVRGPALKELHAEASALMDRFGSVTVRHVPREENGRADELSKMAGRGMPYLGER